MNMTLGHTAALVDECKAQKLLRNQCAYVLATAYWETGHTMAPVCEAFYIAPHDFAKAEAWRKKHLRYWPWYGRGFVQLTWPYNYSRAAKELGVPLDKQPELALDPAVAVKVAVTGMREGWFTGKKLGDYVTLQASDFKGARHIINGTDKDDEIAAIARLYDDELRRLGYN
jgi:putative chitinase